MRYCCHNPYIHNQLVRNLKCKVSLKHCFIYGKDVNNFLVLIGKPRQHEPRLWGTIYCPCSWTALVCNCRKCGWLLLRLVFFLCVMTLSTILWTWKLKCSLAWGIWWITLLCFEYFNNILQISRGDDWGHFNHCNCIALGHMVIAILLW